MKIKKILFYIPAIIFTIFYGFIEMNHIGAISFVVLLWLALFFVSGFILGKISPGVVYLECYLQLI